MGHPIYRVVGFKKTGSYVLLVRFDDGEEREIDFREVLVGELFGPLEDQEMFDQVEIDPRGDGVPLPKLETVMYAETEKKEVFRPFFD